MQFDMLSWKSFILHCSVQGVMRNFWADRIRTAPERKIMIEINQIRRHYLGLTENEIDKYVYRIFPVDRFFEILKTFKNTLVKPKKWDDPFENFILNGCQKCDDGELIPLRNLADKMYGQCWSFKKESDALWRIYCQNGHGIKVRSTPKKLLISLKKGINDENADVSCFIGKVKYFERTKIKELLKSIDIMSIDGSGPAKTLLFKREAFSYENELRIIYYSLDEIKSDIYKYEIKPNEIFDQLVLDPNIDMKTFSKYKRELEILGFKGKILRSSLYDLPKNIVLDGVLKT